MVIFAQQCLLVGSYRDISGGVDVIRKYDFCCYCNHFIPGNVYISWILRVFCKHDGPVDIRTFPSAIVEGKFRDARTKCMPLFVIFVSIEAYRFFHLNSAAI